MKLSHKAELLHDQIHYNLTEDLLCIMERQGISKADLARKLGVTRGRVTKMLSNDGGMTIKTLAKCCDALGIEPKLRLLNTPEH